MDIRHSQSSTKGEFFMKESFSSKSLWFFLVVVLLVFCNGNARAEDDTDQILASVGPHKLTVASFNEQVKYMPPQLQMMMAQNPQMKEQFLDRWVQVTLLSQEARALKLDQDPEVQARVEDVKRSILAQELLKREVEGKVTASDADVKKYYDDHKAEFTQPEMVKARHILIKIPENADDKALSEAEAKANEIKEKLDKGADFAELAKQYSDDPGTKEKGGELGFFTKGRMVPEFEAVAFSSKPGEVSKPVKSPFGYHIIQVQEKQDASVKDFAEVEPQIGQKLQVERQQQLLAEITEKLKAKYPVTINKELLSKISAGPQQGAGPGK
jgi:peptidyl-prolyl cis-trans isomerase C